MIENNGLNKIDFDRKKFVSCGKTYHIIDNFGYKRLSVFLDKIPVIAMGKTALECTQAMATVFRMLTNGNDLMAAQFSAANYLYNFLESAKDTASNEYLFNNLDLYLEFCALFCVTPSEDVTQWNEEIAKQKIEDWKKDMNMMDFFFLAKKQVHMLPTLLLDIQNFKQKEKV